MWLLLILLFTFSFMQRTVCDRLGPIHFKGGWSSRRIHSPPFRRWCFPRFQIGTVHVITDLTYKTDALDDTILPNGGALVKAFVWELNFPCNGIDQTESLAEKWYQAYMDPFHWFFECVTRKWNRLIFKLAGLKCYIWKGAHNVIHAGHS